MRVSTAPEPGQQRPDDPEDDYEPPRAKYLIIAGVVLVACIGLVLLFGGGSSEPDRPAGVEDLAFADGTLTVVEQDRLVMRPFNGSTDLVFAVRPEDAGNFDIAHLQSHSSVGIPTRIFYREEGGTRYAVYKEDAPVNSAQP